MYILITSVCVVTEVNSLVSTSHTSYIAQRHIGGDSLSVQTCICSGVAADHLTKGQRQRRRLSFR
jgi:hypothetical protein